MGNQNLANTMHNMPPTIPQQNNNMNNGQMAPLANAAAANQNVPAMNVNDPVAANEGTGGMFGSMF